MKNNNINEYIKCQQTFQRKNPKLIPNNKLLTIYDDQETKREIFIVDRENKNSKSPINEQIKIKKVNFTPLNRQENRNQSNEDDRKKVNLQMLQKMKQDEEIKEIEQKLEKHINSQQRNNQDLLEQLGEEHPFYRNMFQKLNKIYQNPKKDILDTWISEQANQNEKYINKQFEILMKENQELKDLMCQQRKDLFERMKKENMILDMLKALKENTQNYNTNVQKKEKKERNFKLNLDALKDPNNINGFHQEFMQHLDEFSESWRNLAYQEKKI